MQAAGSERCAIRSSSVTGSPASGSLDRDLVAGGLGPRGLPVQSLVQWSRRRSHRNHRSRRLLPSESSRGSQTGPQARLGSPIPGPRCRAPRNTGSAIPIRDSGCSRGRRLPSAPRAEKPQARRLCRPGTLVSAQPAHPPALPSGRRAGRLNAPGAWGRSKRVAPFTCAGSLTTSIDCTPPTCRYWRTWCWSWKNVPPPAAELSAMQKYFPEPLSAVNTDVVRSYDLITGLPCRRCPRGRPHERRVR